MIEYPENHQQIVKDLLQGKFIVDDEDFFEIVHKHNASYAEFFAKTYGYTLETNGRCYYLMSEKTAEKKSRALLLFLAFLCDAYQDKDIMYKLSTTTFLIEEVASHIEMSTKKAILRNTQVMDRKTHKLNVQKLLNHWAKRSLLAYTDKEKKRFRFREPINIFFHTAFALSKNQLAQMSTKDA